MDSDDDDSNTKFSLFKAYKKDDIGLDVLSTQAANEASATTSAHAATSVPASWLTKRAVVEKTKAENNTILKPAAQPGNCIQVNQRQRGNPVLNALKNVAWQYALIEPDFVLGRNHCAYFLSLRYHNLNPDYICERLRTAKIKYQLTILLVSMDVNPLKEISKLCFSRNMTLMLAWNNEEAARYLEAYKAFENKSPDELANAGFTPSNELAEQGTHFFTSLRRVSKTDAVNLLEKFRSVSEVINSSADQLEKLPGIGVSKARTLAQTFNLPFKRTEY